jgi:hypothetical protein
MKQSLLVLFRFFFSSKGKPPFFQGRPYDRPNQGDSCTITQRAYEETQIPPSSPKSRKKVVQPCADADDAYPHQKKKNCFRLGPHLGFLRRQKMVILPQGCLPLCFCITLLYHTEKAASVLLLRFCRVPEKGS